LYRVIRGGGWIYPARYSRSAARINLFEPGFRASYLGFRVSLVPADK
jgi:formylglycine-generating enzyme required for sulfatase activity